MTSNSLAKVVDWEMARASLRRVSRLPGSMTGMSVASLTKSNSSIRSGVLLMSASWARSHLRTWESVKRLVATQWRRCLASFAECPDRLRARTASGASSNAVATAV